jgi:hypothetical protein
MISEVTFSRDFASFWRQTTPMMDGFVRRINRGGYERDFQPISARTLPNRRAFVNEVAFLAFCNITGNIKIDKPSDLFRLIAESASVISALASQELRQGEYKENLSEDEIGDAGEQVKRLLVRLRESGDLKSIMPKPRFPGCGILDRCEGDIYIEKILFEVKAGDRLVRSIDLRQILIYLALNRASNSLEITGVGLLNPRVGISLEMNVDDICFAVSGRDSSRLLDAIIYGISNGDVSR